MFSTLQQALAFGFLLVVAMSGVFLLAAFYRQGEPTRLARWEHLIARAWDFTPDSIGGFSWSQLALVSLLSLFMEMLMIRWVAAEVSAFAYFKNVVLIAYFLGFGLGCYLHASASTCWCLCFRYAFSVALIKLPWHALRQVIVEIPYFIAPTSQVYLWGMPAVSTRDSFVAQRDVLIVFLSR